MWSLAAICLYLYPNLEQVRIIATLTHIPYTIMRLPTRFYLFLSKPRNNRSKGAKILGFLRLGFTPVFLLVFLLRELLFSQFLELLRVFVYLIQLTVNINWARFNASSEGREGDEDTWGFGQVLPMLLLALPLFAFFESIVCKLPSLSPRNSISNRISSGEEQQNRQNNLD